jgi:holo-[acyl-carrier protein] synthase
VYVQLLRGHGMPHMDKSAFGAPMSIQAGIDLVWTEEVEESVRTHGPRYLERIYTDEELRDCRLHASCLAARFAAKEAVMKVLRRDRYPLDWRSIAVREDADALNTLELTGEAEDLARRRGFGELSVSLASGGRLAAAVVLAQTEPDS